jgi:uncharacterized protein
MREILNVKDILPAQPQQSFDSAVMKIHSMCPLDCKGCYEYDSPSGDRTILQQPREMPMEVVEAFGVRLSEDFCDNPPEAFSIVWHGGEPLLIDPDTFELAARILKKAVGSRTVIQHSVQSAGTLLSPEHLRVFQKFGFTVGISLNGGRKANDLLRVDHAGKSTYDKAVAGVRKMTHSDIYGAQFAGLLAVVDIRNDPVDVYSSLLSHDPLNMDLLLPHGNWGQRPLGLEDEKGRSNTPYGKWYASAFDAWWQSDDDVHIRTFESIMSLLVDGRSSVESVGTVYNDRSIVVNADGSYGMVDTLKTVPGQLQVTGMNVWNNSLKEASEFINSKAEALGATTLSRTCSTCPVANVCESGYVPHRFSPENNSLSNPSVYCLDLAYLISHIYGRLQEKALYNKVVNTISRTAIAGAIR